MKGIRAIRSAQLIFVPRSKSGEQSLALRIAEPWLDRTVQKIVELPLPMTRHTDQLRPAWQEAADRIAASFSFTESSSSSSSGMMRMCRALVCST